MTEFKPYFGILFPFALNFSPSGVSAPPPFGSVWQSAQDFPVSLANCAVASAGAETIKDEAIAITAAAAVPQARANKL